MKENKKTLKYAVITVAVATALVLTYVWLAPYTIEMDMSVGVGNYTGFDVSTDRVTFGTVMQSGISHRDVILANNDNYDKMANFAVEGNIKEFAIVPASQLAKANANTSIPVTASIKSFTEYGNYTGKLKISLRRAVFGM